MNGKISMERYKMKCYKCGHNETFNVIFYDDFEDVVECPVCGAIYRVFTYNPKENKNMNSKTKVERHKELCEYLNELYARKNADYGDSFHITYEQEGMAMPRIRLGDKFNRFCTLSRGNNQQVKDESLRDTLLDLANYALMTVLEMDAEGGQT